MSFSSGFCCFAPVIAAAPGSVWIGNRAGTLWRLDPGSMKVTRSQELPIGIMDLDVEGESLWAAGSGTPGTVFQLNPATGKVVSKIPAGGSVGYAPARIAVDDTRVWVTDGANRSVSGIAIISSAVGPPTALGGPPTSLAVGLGSVWVTVDTNSP
jgi:hypothetical protein